MASKILSATVYGLSWLTWAFQWMVIWPAASLVLIFVLLFWLNNSTPGESLAAEIEFVRPVDSSEGEFFISRCYSGPGLPSVPFCQKEASSRDVYVENIDSSLSGYVTCLWLVMAGVYGGLAYLLGRTPNNLIKTAYGIEYVQCGASHQRTGKGVSVVFPVRKESKKQRIFEVFISSLAARKDDKEL
ncbi:conjugal transfer protein TraP [Serratia fonticola]|uniref:Conjugal transfer protein TraP n=1 Tax=Serratia fonticola TaxID=47917 RepID=A0AAJ1YDL0_SERFO|nr:conjugal transfer protein TraP [Serratia fonticola]MDQ9128478.1 conjugal transfer protein TraP [Serratia fonticola]